MRFIPGTDSISGVTTRADAAAATEGRNFNDEWFDKKIILFGRMIIILKVFSVFPFLSFYNFIFFILSETLDDDVN